MLITPQTPSLTHAPGRAAGSSEAKGPTERFDPSDNPDVQICYPFRPGGAAPPRPRKCWPGGVGVPSPAAGPAPATKAEIQSAVAANNDFSLDLHRQLAAGNKEGFFLSAFNVNGCMSMVLAAAGDTTADGLAGALKQTALEGDRVHAAVGGLNQATAVQSEGVNISISNRVFSQVGSQHTPEFKAITRDSYQAEAENLNFRADPEAARQTINGKVSGDTNEKIPNLLPEGSIKSNTDVVLTSAIHFDGKWEARFPEESNFVSTFNSPDGPKDDVTFMQIKKDFKFAEIFFTPPDPNKWGAEPDVKLVELPYQGGRFSRLVLLPKAGVEAVEARLTAENLAAWTGQMREDEVNVVMPKNEVRSKFELKDTLSAMGAAELFTDGAAQLPGFGEGNRHVSQVFHETWVKDDNVGTEFAAATGAVVALECAMRSNEVVCDKPYLTLVKDNETGAILATQRVLCPEWTESK